MNEQVRLPGILGGLGPAAHVEFENRLLLEGVRRGAQRDQDHIAWVLVSATNVPERTEALLEAETRECIAQLAIAARRLVAAGAEFAAVPCNTAHALRDEVVAETGLPWLDLIDVTIEVLKARYPENSRILVLSTTGTMQTGLYRRRLREAGFKPVEFEPDSADQTQVMRAIFDPQIGVKATGPRIDEAAQEIARRSLLGGGKVACAIAGCTELSVVFAQTDDLPLEVIDPLDALAAATYDVALGLRSLPQAVSAARR